jgi:excisionase family DNA binding protein
MARLPPPNRIKTHRIYTVWEAADLLGRHRRTIIRWITSGALVADRSRKPWLIVGADLKAYLGLKRTARRQKLAAHHIYCVGCRSPREPAGRTSDYTQMSTATGMLSAICPACERTMNKLVSRANLKTIRAKIEVSVRQADPRLVSRTGPLPNVTFTEEPESHVKARLG